MNELTVGSMAADAAIQFFVQISINEIEKFLREFKRDLSGGQSRSETSHEELPSAAILGIGRCGSNISMLVADILSKSAAASESDTQPKVGEPAANPILSRLVGGRNGKKEAIPISIVNPVIMIADLDKDTYSRIEQSKKDVSSGRYKKLRPLTQIRELQGGGAGNIPILGQYMGRVALNIRLNEETSPIRNKEWVLDRTYFIDSAGSDLNNSRLFFYVFSTGGGSGSGMAPEFGLAQQYANLMKVRQARDHISSELPGSGKVIKFEPICSVGIGVLPNVQETQVNNALYLNSGRALCRYLAQERRFSRSFSYENLSPLNLHTFNGFLLVSNNIMKWIPSEDSKAKKDKEGTVAEVEERTNQYIAQQVFNLLTAQALGAEHGFQDVFKHVGIDAGDTIRLDANDLNNSVNGPMIVAYAESLIGKLEAKDLLRRAISIPRRNPDTNYLEGISVLPVLKENYEAILRDSSDDLFLKLAKLPLFRGANALVTIISVPEEYDLVEKDLRELQNLLVQLFPNAPVRRFSLVKGASTRNISFTILISGSACTCSEVFSHILTYINACFRNQGTVPSEEEFVRRIMEAVKSSSFDPGKMKDLLLDHENLASIVAGYEGPGNWELIKGIYEANFRSILGPDSFMPIDNVRLTRQDILDALEYINQSLTHVQSKTIMVDLSDESS